MAERQSTVSGLEGLEKALIELGGEVGGKALRGAGMDAMKIVLDDQLANVPVGDETRMVKGKGGAKVELRPGFMRSRIKRKSQARFTRRGSVRKGFGKDDSVRVQVGVFKVLYAYWVEFGTAHHGANPFIRNSLKNNEGRVVNRFAGRLALRINKAAKRLRQKHGKK